MCVMCEITAKEAFNLYNLARGQNVLVAVQDLGKDEVASFETRDKKDCEQIIKDGKTIACLHNGFINQLRVFTEKQMDIMNIEPRGMLSTILIRI